MCGACTDPALRGVGTRPWYRLTVHCTLLLGGVQVLSLPTEERVQGYLVRACWP